MPLFNRTNMPMAERVLSTFPPSTGHDIGHQDADESPVIAGQPAATHATAATGQGHHLPLRRSRDVAMQKHTTPATIPAQAPTHRTVPSKARHHEDPPSHPPELVISGLNHQSVYAYNHSAGPTTSPLTHVPTIRMLNAALG